MIYFTGDLFLGLDNFVDVDKELLNTLDRKNNKIIINLESVILENCLPNSRLDKSSIIYTDRKSFLYFANQFKKAELFFNMGNNHLHDFGYSGILETIKFFDQNNVNYFGFKSKDKDLSYIIISDQGIRVKLVATSTDLMEVMSCTTRTSDFYISDYNFYDYQSPIKKDFDINVLLPHWGKEYIDYPKSEILNLSINWIKHNVDFVIGNHPHVIQGSIYNSVFFSLGNFYFKNFRKKNGLWHIWSRKSRESILVGLDVKNKKTSVIGLIYNNSSVRICENSFDYYISLSEMLSNLKNNKKLYYSFFETEYYKFLKLNKGLIVKIKLYVNIIKIKIYEKLFKKDYY